MSSPALFRCMYRQLLSWWQDVPLPIYSSAPATFQFWHQFTDASERWVRVGATFPTSTSESESQSPACDDPKITLVTWNIDAFADCPEARISAVVSHILSFSPAPDVIFLQEVCRLALTTLLEDPRIRESFYSSEADATNWEGVPFATVLLLSRSRFKHPDQRSTHATLGPVWRVKYPSHFGRDALCCDVLVFSRTPGHSVVTPSRIRLINVHLDSLPIQPSERPQQIATIASFLRSAGRGLVAGDFNPVLPEDETLVAENGLTDAWTALRGEEPGLTWGISGEEPFPPARLDKVATANLEVENIEVIHPGVVMKTMLSGHVGVDETETVPWSDHSGLVCSFNTS